MKRRNFDAVVIAVAVFKSRKTTTTTTTFRNSCLKLVFGGRAVPLSKFIYNSKFLNEVSMHGV